MSSRAEHFPYFTSFFSVFQTARCVGMLSHRIAYTTSHTKTLNGEHVLFFRPTPGTISCPICLDSYCEVTFNTSVANLDGRLNSALWLDCWCLQIVDSGRLVVSTKCGHVFCSQCLRDALTSSHMCPTCRKRLTHREYHPLYVWHHHTVLQFAFFFFSLLRNWLLKDY